MSNLIRTTLASIGGRTQTEITGTGASQDLPAKCIMLVPNKTAGFTPTSIKVTGDVEIGAGVNGTNYADYDGAIIPTTGIVDDNDVWLTKVTFGVGQKCLAICL